MDIQASQFINTPAQLGLEFWAKNITYCKLIGGWFTTELFLVDKCRPTSADIVLKFSRVGVQMMPLANVANYLETSVYVRRMYVYEITNLGTPEHCFSW